MVVTEKAEWAERMRCFRNHGIDADLHARAAQSSWAYEMTELGYNYRITDIQCALGVSQLRKRPQWLARRREIAAAYDQALARVPWVEPLAVRPDRRHAYHLYVVKVVPDALGASRKAAFDSLRAQGIGVNVHYMPVYLHPFYRERFGYAPGLCPVAEAEYERLLSLPMFPGLSDDDVTTVVTAIKGLKKAVRRAG